MRFSESLKKNKDFQNVYRNGKSFANRYFVMYLLENNLEKNRIGISVSKKIGNSVIRHRITRLLRESYRLNEDNFKRGYDMIFIGRIGAADIAYDQAESAMIHLADLHKVLVN